MKTDNWFIIAKLLALTGLVIFILIFLYLFYFNEKITLLNPIDLEAADQIGGYISGIVGVLWSGAGVILIYATFQKQKEFNEKQAFEQTFHNLINNYHTIINNTRGKIIENPRSKKYRDEEIMGRRFYSVFLQNLLKKSYECDPLIRQLLKDNCCKETKEFWDDNKKHKSINKKNIINFKESFLLPKTKNKKINNSYFNGKPISEPNKPSNNLVVKIYEYYYQYHQSVLGHYFRFLFNIFKYIIDNNATEKERKKYINLIQAQMSNDELGILFYNALSQYSKNKHGKYQFKEWLERFNFFENIDENSLINISDTRFYKNQNYRFIK